MDDLKVYNKQEFEIKLNTTRPIFQMQFKMSPEHSRILQKRIDDLKAKNILEDSETFWYNVPLFIVPKASLRDAKDKSDYRHYRPVADLRLLNSHISPLAIYTQPISDIVQEVTKFSDEKPPKRANWYTTLDFMNGFLQLGLKKGLTRDCLSFRAPDGKVMTWTRVPFGCKLSPTFFSLVMTKITAPMRAKGGFCFYLDDCCIFSTDEKSHLEKIDEFLSILIDNDLKCSVAKSFFLENRIKFIGVIIDENGISVPQEVTRTLDKLQTMKIKTQKQLCSC